MAWSPPADTIYHTLTMPSWRGTSLIFMSGDLVENGEGTAGRDEAFYLQKPFRISDVLALLREVFAASPAEIRPN